MSASIDEVARHSTDLELVAEAVHHSKEYLVALDRRLNQTREGLRNLTSNSQNIHDDSPVWLLCPGGIFVQAKTSRAAMKQLEGEMGRTAKQIEAEREKLKGLVVELARLEGPDSALARLHQGFSLRDGK